MKYYTSLFVLLFLMACQPHQKWPNEVLHGQWDSVSWTNLNTNKPINNQLDFDFGTDGRYELDYGTKKVQGKYWMEDDFLHTIEDGQSEIKVKILNVNTDSLIIDMNRGGKMERVVLTKVK